MDVKVTGNYAVYQKAVNSGKHIEKGNTAPAPGQGKTRGDEVCISSEGARKSEASGFASALCKSMEEGAGSERLAALKQSVQDGTYEISAQQIARRLMSGL